MKHIISAYEGIFANRESGEPIAENQKFFRQLSIELQKVHGVEYPLGLVTNNMEFTEILKQPKLRIGFLEYPDMARYAVYDVPVNGSSPHGLLCKHFELPVSGMGGGPMYRQTIAFVSDKRGAEDAKHAQAPSIYIGKERVPEADVCIESCGPLFDYILDLVNNTSYPLFHEIGKAIDSEYVYKLVRDLDAAWYEIEEDMRFDYERGGVSEARMQIYRMMRQALSHVSNTLPKKDLETLFFSDAVRKFESVLCSLATRVIGPDRACPGDTTEEVFDKRLDDIIHGLKGKSADGQKRVLQPYHMDIRDLL